MKNTLATLLMEEAKRFNGFCYCSFPYSCGLPEATTYAKEYAYPKTFTVDKENEKMTKIIIPPMKGSGKRKNFVITLWVS